MAFSQREFLVTLNYTNANYNIIDSIPGVMWILDGTSAFDENHHLYFFEGNNTGISPWYLYAVNAITRQTVHRNKLLVNGDSSGSILELAFNNQTGLLNGIYLNNILGTADFVSIVPESGAVTVLNPIPDFNGIGVCSSTFDQNHHRYIFEGYLSGERSRIISIDANNGEIVSSPEVTPYPVHGYSPSSLFYNNDDNKLYGFYQDDGTFNWDSINITTAAANLIADIPELAGITGPPKFKALDERDHRFIFLGLDHASDYRLYSIDFRNGNILSDPVYPYATNAVDQENVIELIYDNKINQLYALHWGPEPTSVLPSVLNDCVEIRDVKVFPNPFASEAIIDLTKEIPDVTITLYDVLGRRLLSGNYHNVSEIKLKKGSLPQSICFLTIECNGHLAGTIPINIEE